MSRLLSFVYLVLFAFFFFGQDQNCQFLAIGMHVWEPSKIAENLCVLQHTLHEVPRFLSITPSQNCHHICLEYMEPSSPWVEYLRVWVQDINPRHILWPERSLRQLFGRPIQGFASEGSSDLWIWGKCDGSVGRSTVFVEITPNIPFPQFILVQKRGLAGPWHQARFPPWQWSGYTGVLRHFEGSQTCVSLAIRFLKEPQNGRHAAWVKTSTLNLSLVFLTCIILSIYL